MGGYMVIQIEIQTDRQTVGISYKQYKYTLFINLHYFS